MIRMYFSLLVFFVFSQSVEANDIEFIVDGCPYVEMTIQVVGSYESYQWNDPLNPLVEFDTTNSITVYYSSTFCVTVTDDNGMSCNACVDIEILETEYPVISSSLVCQFDVGLGPTVVDFVSLIVVGQLGGEWIDHGGTGVNLGDPSNVDFSGVPIGEYEFSYSYHFGDCQLIFLIEYFTIQVIDCDCPSIEVPPFGEICNDVLIDLNTYILWGEAEASSSELNIIDNVLDLNGLSPGTYDLTFNWFDIPSVCPNMFETTIDVIGCFNVQDVLFAESELDQVIFSWTDELQALDLSIEVLQGPEGVRDGNTYTISGLLPGEEVGIEIFVNTEGYLYDNDLIIYGQSLTTSIQESELLSDIILYPNPVQDHLYIDCSPLEYNIISTISSSNGYRVFKIKDLNHNSIDISDLPSGMYYLTLEAVDGIKKLPFVKQ